jgi:hypothetical protein
MRVGRGIGLVMAAALGLSGCRAAGTGSLALHPRPLPPRTALDVDAFVAEHNRNAERIRSLEARPSITVTMGRRRGGHVGGHIAHVDGRLAMERPQNFKLELSSPRSTVADIGSNDDEFWFWVENSQDKSIYWCKHSEVESSALAVAYQPDWIIDALGLKPIAPDDAARIQARPGPSPGTTSLIFPPIQAGGETYYKELIVTDSDRRMQEHRIYAADRRTVVLRAETGDYKEYDLPVSDRRFGETCVLPEHIRLDWVRDQLVLDATLREVEVNQFDPARRADLFVEPEYPGYTRRNLAELTGGTREERRTRFRQTMPPPGPPEGVKLGRPAPLNGNEDAPVVPQLGRAAVRRGTGTNRTVPPSEEVVGAPVPTPPLSQAPQAAYSELTKADTPGFPR